MTRSVDPFEEYLRKKKVELLEQKYRGEESAPPSATVAEEPDSPALSELPDDERLQEEMDEFFHAGQEAGAELFSRVGDGLSEDKVEEIRDALDDVFEEEAPAPKTEDAGESFADFFAQVQDEFIKPSADGPPPPAEEPVATVEPDLAQELEAPAPPDAGLAPVDLLPTAAEPLPIVEAPRPRPQLRETDDDPSEAEIQRAHLAAAAVGEVSTDDVDTTTAADDSAPTRLSLADILTPPRDDAELRQRVDLLCRLTAKLVERLQLPENEIIEVLIKSGVEF